MATLVDFPCLTQWSLTAVDVGRTSCRCEVIVVYQYDAFVGNINQYLNEAQDALERCHLWLDELPVAVFLERDS